MWRVGITTNRGRIEAKNFNTRDKVDDYILSFSDTEIVTHFRIEKDGIVIETERGKQ